MEYEQELIDESMIDEDNFDEQMEADSDMAYERWREEWGEKLDEVLTDTYNMFVLPKGQGYYKGNAERFVRHSIDILTQLTNTKIVVKGKMVSVVPKEIVKQNSLMDFTKEEIAKAESKGMIEVKNEIAH